MRTDNTLDTLTTVDNVEMVECDFNFLDVSERLFSHKLEYNPFSEYVTGMFKRKDLFKSQGKGLLQNLAKKIGLSV